MLPQMYETQTTRQAIDTFLGYDHRLKTQEGSWYDEQNLTADYFPLFANREPRGIVEEGGHYRAISARDALLMIQGSKVVYNGLEIDGITLSEEEDMLPKKLVNMGAYVCIFPDGAYVNTADLTDCGMMGLSRYTIGNVTIEPCKQDGETYDMTDIASPDEPEDPANGQLWLDTSSVKHSLKVYSSSTGMWSPIATVYLKLSCTGIGTGFKEGDAVTFSGFVYDGDNQAMRAQIEDLNASHVLRGSSDDYVIITGLIDQVYTMESSLAMERKVPRMQHVCELNNRLWGCYYGIQDGKMVNEIYACKLGDFKNWYCYDGISTDSYAVTVGTDGEFTGAIAHLGYVCFFKDDCLHKISGTQPSNFRVTTTQMRGVQRGSEDSLVIVNEVLYYKSRTDVCAYDGSLPTGISDSFGTEIYHNASAGSYGRKYYLSMQDSNGDWQMFVYDTGKGIWHREDQLHAVSFTSWGDELYCIDADHDRILALNGTIEGEEQDIEWYAESGIIGYDLVDHEYVSRFNYRMKLGRGATITTFIEYDDSGIWERQNTVLGDGLVASFILPVIPRRCDHFRIKLSGKGDIRIYSMAKIISQGSDVS